MKKVKSKSNATTTQPPKNTEYSMLFEEEEPIRTTSKKKERSNNQSSGTQEKQKKVFLTKSIRKRERKDDEEEGEPTVIQRRAKRAKTEPVEEESEDDKIHEDEAEKDRRERIEFEERLRQKEEEKIRRKNKKKTEELADNADLEQKRILSRIIYLGKTAEEKVQEIIEDTEMEAKEFHQTAIRDQLTEAEKFEHAKNKLIAETASNYIQSAKEAEIDDAYRIPTGYAQANGKLDFNRREDLLKQRYPDKNARSSGNTYFDESEAWVENTTRSAINRFGAQQQPKTKPEYELLTEESIEFEIVKGLALKGNIEDDEEPRPTTQNRTLSQKEALQEVRKRLPIYQYRDHLINAVKKNQIIIIEGETGSGKTTQITQYLHEEGFTHNGKKIGCTQPRRVAAMSVAKRVADEMGVTLGGQVGYSIRFEDCTSEKTIIKYMTDGMLLREFLTDPSLESYSVIMIDEAHERTLHTDVLFGLVKDIARFRPDLKLLISSATLDVDKFSKFFDFAPIFRIPGRRFKVDVHFTVTPEPDYLDAAIVTVLQIHLLEPLGDILVFLTGQEEVETAAEALRLRTQAFGSSLRELIITKIYGSLPSEVQAQIFRPTPPGARKVVLATNIAETSLTIEGIKYVVDPGFSKQKSYNSRTGMESLQINPISKANAEQRAGRAGRTSPGRCYRLYTAWSYDHDLLESTVPEIQRTNLGNVVLMLKSLGIDDILTFDFMDPPPVETLLRAHEELYALNALNASGELTKTGRRMAEFPLDPMLSKMIIASEKYKCSSEVLTIASMLSVNNALFYRPKDKKVAADTAIKALQRKEGDHLTLLNVYNEWVENNMADDFCQTNFIQPKSMRRAFDVREQIKGLLERVEIEEMASKDSEAVRKAITSGYFYHIAKLDNFGNYKTMKGGQTVYLHPSSSLFGNPPKCVVYHELVFTSKEYMREIIEIKADWLLEVAGHFYTKQEVGQADTKKMPKTIGKAGIRE